MAQIEVFLSRVYAPGSNGRRSLKISSVVYFPSHPSLGLSGSGRWWLVVGKIGNFLLPITYPLPTKQF